MNLMTVMTT
jgi:hypothetical protein